MDRTPLVLEGALVRLEPLTRDHLAELKQVAFDPSIWRYISVWVTNERELEEYVETALTQVAAGQALVWATRSKSDGKIAGSSRLYDISEPNRTMELGWTWLNPRYHRTGINVEAKYLQLRHAFEVMKARRVALKTHHENLRSQAAIAAIGAKQEGIFRNHMIMPDGSTRHSVWYSIIEEEWPEVKVRLQNRLERARGEAEPEPLESAQSR